MTRVRHGDAKAMRLALLLVALGVAAPAAGQTATEQGVWTAVQVQGRVGGADSPWRWALDTLVTTTDGVRTLDAVAAQATVARNLTPRSSAGYVYGARFLETGTTREHRLFQQYTWTGGLGRHVSFRSRLEERFVTGHAALRLRVRQRVRVTWPLGARNRLRGVVSEEVFLQVNSTRRASRGFESNQVSVGVERRLTARGRLEIGYTNVYARGGSGRRRRSHVCSATLVMSR